MPRYTVETMPRRARVDGPRDRTRTRAARRATLALRNARALKYAGTFSTAADLGR